MKIKSILWGILFCVIESISGFAQTTIPGGVVSGTWTKANSPYLVQAAIMVADGTTLTIEPGVKIEFQGSFKLLVLGNVIAGGAVNDTITFTAADTSKGWLGVRFENTSSTNDTSRFMFCKFQHGKALYTPPLDKGGAFYLENFSKVIISNSTIAYCKAESDGSAIYCLKSNPIIKDNKIIRNVAKRSGTIASRESNTLILRNLISYNVTGFYGGGIYCEFPSTTTIMANTISHNSGGIGGGIACAVQASSIISKNSITYNKGGGITCPDGGTHQVLENTISYNSSIDEGAGGIKGSGTTITIKGNTVSYNTCAESIVYGAGGISIYISIATISNNLIHNNSVLKTGAGGINFIGDGEITNNIIANNKAVGGGAGIYTNTGSTISNNLIVNNSASTAEGSGGIYCKNCDAKIINNTIANNSAVNGGGVVCVTSSNPVLKNNIIWGNKASAAGNQLYFGDEASDPSISFCDIQGGKAAFGTNANVFYLGSYTDNLDVAPVFVNPSANSGSTTNGLVGDWRLMGNSPCINSGDPNGGPYAATDIIGNTRVLDGIIDMGAYEILITGIKNATGQMSFTIYPNPSNGEFNIDARDMKINSIDVYNMIGAHVFSMNSPGKKCALDFTYLPKGIYFLNMQINETRYTEKIVIQ